MSQIARQGAPQQLAGMQRVVLNAGHHVGAAETLRIFERGVGHQFAGLEVEQTQHHGGGAQVHGDAVASGADTAAWQDHRRHRRPPAPLRRTGSTFDLHLAAPHGVAPDLALRGHNLACCTTAGNCRSDGARAVRAPRGSPSPPSPPPCTPCICPSCGRRWGHGSRGARRNRRATRRARLPCWFR